MWTLSTLWFAWAMPALAGEDEVEAFFEAHVKKAAAFDPSIAEDYADDATMRLLSEDRTVEMSGEQLKAQLPTMLEAGKASNDVSTYSKVKVKEAGDRYRITARRFSEAKCYLDKDYEMVVEEREGAYRVVEEQMRSVAFSQCEMPRELSAAINDLVGQIRPHLPLDLDEETRLLSVESSGRGIVYTMKLPTFAAAEWSPRADPIFAQIAVAAVCNNARARQLAEREVTFRYTYLAKDDTPLRSYDITKRVCALVEAASKPADAGGE